MNSLIAYYSLPANNWQKLDGKSKGTFNSWDEANAYLDTLEGCTPTSENGGDESDGKVILEIYSSEHGKMNQFLWVTCSLKTHDTRLCSFVDLS